MSRPAASVVITNYNYARFLREAIDSALAQTLPAVEVIVVDDGSTDESRAIVDAYGDAVHPVLKENGGQTSAINAGAEVATGDFVVFLDADDTIAPDTLANAAELFGPEVSRVLWRLWEVDERGRRTGRVQPDWGEPASGSLRELTLQRGPDSYVLPPQSGNAFSRAVLDMACPLMELEREWGTGSAHADTFLVDVAGLLGEARELPEPGGTYRVHAANEWAQRSAVEKLERSARLFRERCTRLARSCEELGLPADREAWRRESWVMRTIRAREELEASVPAAAALTVADDNAVSSGVAGDRPTMPFPERNGEYWGSPESDDDAIDELERVRAERGGFFAVLWPAFWWYETYPRFVSHLESTVACVRRTDDLRLYSLEDAPPPA